MEDKPTTWFTVPAMQIHRRHKVLITELLPIPDGFISSFRYFWSHSFIFSNWTDYYIIKIEQIEIKSRMCLAKMDLLTSKKEIPNPPFLEDHSDKIYGIIVSYYGTLYE